MNIEQRNKISSALSVQNNIKFAYLFGSALNEKKRYGSDIDIAVYFENEPDLNTIGELVLTLEEIAKSKIDLVQLNDLDKLHPSLAHSILSSGVVLLVKDEASLRKFKTAVLLQYLDFKFAIDLIDTAFNKRISSNKFAVFEK